MGPKKKRGAVNGAEEPVDSRHSVKNETETRQNDTNSSRNPRKRARPQVDGDETSTPKRRNNGPSSNVPLLSPHSDGVPSGAPSPPEQTASNGSVALPGSAVGRLRAWELPYTESTTGLPDNLSLFKPGAILKMRLHNFQVCTDAQYRFGPALNMIIAPNGSGKSTVVTAIFLMFGGRKGDKQDFSRYVRIGTDSARVEATLRGEPGRPNPLLVMTISKIDGDKHQISYTLNGKAIRSTSEISSHFGIQVDNLTQFLPQERVGAFSAESAEERLKSTEKAISSLGSNGSLSLIDAHNELIKLGPQLAAAVNSSSSNTSRIAELEQKKKECEDIITELERQQAEETKLAELTAVRPILKFKRLQDAKDVIERELRDIEAEAASIEDALAGDEAEKLALENRLSEIHREVSDAELGFRNARKDCELGLQRYKTARVHLTQADNEFRKVVKSRESWQEENTQAQEVLSKARSYFEQRRAQAHTPEEYEALRLKTEEWTRLLDDSLDRKTRKEREISRKRNELVQHTNKLDRINRDIQRTPSGQTLRLEEAYSLSNGKQRARIASLRKALDVMKTVQFIEEVYPPPVICGNLNSLNEQQLRQLSAVVNEDLLFKFTTQNKNDYKKLRDLFYNNGIRANIIDISMRARTRAEYVSPLNAHEMRNVKLQGWIIDLLKAPEPVLAMLCIAGKLHLVPYSTSTPIMSDPSFASKIKRYVTSNSIVSLNQSSYGQQNVITSENVLGPPRVWIKVMTRAQDEARLNTSIKLKADLEAELAKLKQDEENFKSELAMLDDERKTLLQDAEPSKQDFRAAVQNKKEVENAEDRFNRAQRVVDELKARFGQFDSKISTRVKAIETAVNELDAAKRVLSYHGLQTYSTKLETLVKEREGTSQHIQRLAEEIRSRKEQVKEKLQQVREKLETARAELSGYHRESIVPLKQKLGATNYLAAEQRAAHMNLDDVVREIAEVEAALLLAANGHSLEGTKKLLETTVEELIRRQQEERARLSRASDLEQQVNAIRTNWERTLETTINDVSSRFSRMFSELNYRGEVELTKSEDYNEWGLEILVSFRQGEPLRPLSGRRQSGGERAVSTAIYLLALQGYSNAPFHVVDEINQGMDRFNEMNVQKLLVERTCGSDSSQYFLITPKLLQDLPYHAGMVIHTIFGGDAVSRKKPNFSQLLDQIRQDLPEEEE